MKFYELLPVPKVEIAEWSRAFLIDVHKTLAEIVDEEQQGAKRERNTKLASYLGTLNALLSTKRQQLNVKRREYIAKHPKPEKGITEWREEVDSANYDLKLLCEHVEGVIEAIHLNISTEQSNLKSYGREGQS